MRTGMHDEAGMMGKLVIVWALLFALVGVAAVDTVSIMFTTFHLSDVAAKAASEGLDTYAHGKNAREACDAAAAFVRGADDTIKIPESGFCTVNPQTGRVKITVETTARTFLAGRLSATKKYAHVVETAAAGSSAV
jgi:hypothetical protein